MARTNPWTCMEDQGSRAQVRDAVVRAAAASGWDNAGWAITTYRAMELRRQTFYLWLANVCAVLLVSLLHDFKGIEFYINDSEHSTILTFLALLVAFRSQQAYERWWEGRKLLGSLNNASRSLASLAAAWVTDGNRRDRIIMRTIVFFWSVRASLRRERLDPSEMAGLLDARQVSLLNDSTSIPMLVIDTLRAEFADEAREQQATAAPAPRLGLWEIAVDEQLKALVDALGGSERIARTPMPRGPHAMLRVFSAVWIFTFPLAISDE